MANRSAPSSLHRPDSQSLGEPQGHRFHLLSRPSSPRTIVGQALAVNSTVGVLDDPDVLLRSGKVVAVTRVSRSRCSHHTGRPLCGPPGYLHANFRPRICSHDTLQMDPTPPSLLTISNLLLIVCASVHTDRFARSISHFNKSLGRFQVRSTMLMPVTAPLTTAEPVDC